MLETKPKTAFAKTSGKWHWKVAPFSICWLSGLFCYLMSQVLSGLDFCFAYLDDILVYSTSWKEHPATGFGVCKGNNFKNKE